MRLLLVAALVAVALAGPQLVGDDDGGRAAHRARVLAVIDGDTVRVSLGGRRVPVRVIGIDTPETRASRGRSTCFNRQATRAMRRLVEGRVVRLVADREDRDRFARLLRYVELPREGAAPLDAGAVLLRGGFADVLEIAPNTSRARRYRALRDTARRDGRGLWSACRGAANG